MCSVWGSKRCPDTKIVGLPRPNHQRRPLEQTAAVEYLAYCVLDMCRRTITTSSMVNLHTHHCTSLANAARLRQRSLQLPVTSRPTATIAGWDLAGRVSEESQSSLTGLQHKLLQGTGPKCPQLSSTSPAMPLPESTTWQAKHNQMKPSLLQLAFPSSPSASRLRCCTQELRVTPQQLLFADGELFVLWVESWEGMVSFITRCIQHICTAEQGSTDKVPLRNFKDWRTNCTGLRRADAGHVPMRVGKRRCTA